MAEQVNVMLGQRIRELRRLRQMNQSELARELGVTFQQVQKYEQGTNRIAVSTLLQIAHALKVRPEALLGDTLPGGSLGLCSSADSLSPKMFAEQLQLTELFVSIDDPVWRGRVLELLELLSAASRRGG
ncbi:helix-turn-helix domain-containing protein [Falsiroseomonas sp.]|uniref:helix-turn-helix domain-containing protein n=1 Tax=Falsiroseomonas sp. TaxID=2870721 RepID=UPI003F711E8C